VRHGATLRFAPADFANPAARALFQVSSGGSRSPGTPIDVPPEDLVHHARLRRWLLAGYGLDGRDVVLWAPPTFGLSLIVEYALGGRPPLRWFSPVGHHDAGQAMVLRAARLGSRMRLPSLEVAPPTRTVEVARAISRLNGARGLVVETFPSAALRLVLTAAAERIPLGDVAFILTGEPTTARKRQQIEAHGCRVVPRFGFNELGRIAWACPASAEPDDMHVMTDMVAVCQYPRPLADGQTTVKAYLFTTLLPYARSIMLNMESGDYGPLEVRQCGCFLGAAGLTQHLSAPRSFEKLTAEGMTFAGSNLVALVEAVLPREFGGDGRHYQLVEAEDAHGFTRFNVLVSPHLGPLDDGAVRAVVLRELGERPHWRKMRPMWEHADTIRVLRRDPLPTLAGKILHLHRHRGLLEDEAV
jgi:hypothetical protein